MKHFTRDLIEHYGSPDDTRSGSVFHKARFWITGLMRCVGKTS